MHTFLHKQWTLLIMLLLKEDYILLTFYKFGGDFQFNKMTVIRFSTTIEKI